ncbi:hypothetical protein [Cellulomonas sp. ES6]|uniref:hypothetical protein n=1 Tax=Cellulomonas sp. ES6 TaxID=3039384 RepID=UPI0024B7C943|nr:hypothetical protein [Cellulomonas sp. ES6]WHP16941.1 hypothetical protein P9841_15260 [Cellulomonas sp. ES6]
MTRLTVQTSGRFVTVSSQIGSMSEGRGAMRVRDLHHTRPAATPAARGAAARGVTGDDTRGTSFDVWIV